MSFPRQPRRDERRNWEQLVRLDALENDADQNEREHQAIRESTHLKTDEIKNKVERELDILKARVDRLTWALATASLSFALMALTFVLTN